MAFILKVCLGTGFYASVTEKHGYAGYYSQMFCRLGGVIFYLGQLHCCIFHFYLFCSKMTYETGACWNEKFSWIKSTIFISLFLVLQEDNHLWDKILFCTTQRRVSEKEFLSCSCIQGYPKREQWTRTTVIPPTFTNQ